MAAITQELLLSELAGPKATENDEMDLFVWSYPFEHMLNCEA